ncbi:MAG: hypothetical protein [Bacteriophage sp.]|jgi:hypothetical protein|nr:MAG: hypothetical protein [Bacteriophage sp.]UVX33298.1 MAG: hypothetical protein [Bacteriophage sp.]UVY03338.1 MAG: hypothetical protein [Bacteriophage sp.]UWF79216.1 MAG: hypothetical protein [Bacteriophage sp.]UWF82311.1 MAG: hypothetical protein [Bacteriophage sp.]
MAKKKVKSIKVYVNGKWENVLNQKIYKDGKWLTFTTDSGINKDGIWYVL